MTKHFAGARIHTLRRSKGLTQVEMAKRLNISTSYLNQLENDQRPLTVTVLMNLSSHFQVEPGYFSSDRDARMLAQLQEAFPGVADEQLADLAARYPDLAPRLVSDRTPAQTPYEIVRDFYYQSNNYFDQVDVAAEELALALGSLQFRVPRMAERMERDTGVTVRFRGPHDGPRRSYHPLDQELVLRTGLRESQLMFEMALQYALIYHAELIDHLVDPLPTAESRDVARLGLAQTFAAGVTMPYTEFLERAEDTRYDIDRLAQHFHTSFESTAHRLSTLQRPRATGVPFFFIRTDRAGNISKRASATGFHFARTGGSCPLWAIHRAFEVPSRVTRQIARMPDGRTYLWVARYVAGMDQGFGRPRKEFAVGLGCDLDQAHRLVYSDGLDLSGESATDIGPGCATCSRHSCPQRAFPYEGGQVVVDLNASHDQAYLTRRD